MSKVKSVDKGLEKWTDEECLVEFAKFINSRVGISTQFIQNEDDLLTHQVMAIQCGEKILVSDPQELDWPLQPLPMPEAFKKEKAN